MTGHRQSGLKLLVDYLDQHELAALSALRILFTLYEYNRPLTIKQIYKTGSGYRRAQLRYMAEIGLLDHQLSDAQRRGRNPTPRPTAYGLTAKGRYHINKLMARECPNIEDSDHLSRWLTLITNRGVDNFPLLRLLVRVEQSPDQCNRELFNYRSGCNTSQVMRLVEHGLLIETIQGSRKEKSPGKQWMKLRGYLNSKIPDTMLGQ